MKILTLICLSFITIQCYAQKEEIAKIDSIVSYYIENGMFNGTLLIAKKNEIIYHKSFGYSDVESGKELNTNTPFCLASITKQFTATAIMILENQNKLKFTNTIGQIFPELPEYLHQIKIVNLLQHTSGLKRSHYKHHEKLNNEEVYGNLMRTASDTLLFEPNTDLNYSNTSYILLALIIEKISGQSYQDFLEEKIFAPLGMTNTFVFSNHDKGRNDIAIAYDGFGNKDDYNVLTYGSAGIYSTPEDLFRWTQSFTTDQILPYDIKKRAYEQVVSKSGKVLDSKIRENTWGYGFGLRIFRDSLAKVVGHSGAFGGFYNVMAKDMKYDNDVIILSNNGRLLDINNFGKLFLNILRRQEYEMPLLSIDKAIRQMCIEDIDKGISYYHQLKSNFIDKYKFNNEQELNRLGYALLKMDDIEGAIKIFKLLISEFPDSPNPYDSLGEAYYQKEDYEQALANYRKAIEFGGTYGNAKYMINKIEKLK